MRLTIKDIAKMAGVSPTAVSFAINGKGSISEETRQKVNEVIRQTGFRPSINSRRLSARKSFNICVAFDMGASLFSDMFYLGVTKGVQQEAGRLGYNIVLTDFSSGMPDIILDRDTDGVIFFQDLEKPTFDVVKELSVPFVVADSHVSRAPYATVGVDNQRASFVAVRHLLDMGHRDIAIIGPGVFTNLFETAHRGYTEALLECGIMPDRDYIVASEETTTGAGDAMERLLKLSRRPTAVYCPGDRLAVGAMLRAQEHGVRVPEDISFVSLDDTMLCRYVRPMLSAVHIDMEAMGVAAMQLLGKRMDGHPAENLLLTMDALIERGSVSRRG